MDSIEKRHMMKLKKLYLKFIGTHWELGFIENGLDGVFSNKPLKIKVIKNPPKDRWFADPFILHVDENEIHLLAEEMLNSKDIGRIAKIIVNRKTMMIEKLDVVLELPTHLSFPNILRYQGQTYVYPENCLSGKQDIYEYDFENDKLKFLQTICDDVIWDATMTDFFGEWLLFTANKNDFNLDIYKWNEAASRFKPYLTIPSDRRNSRMAGQLFKYNGKIYCPCQDCSKTYGGSVVVKEVESNNGNFVFREVKRVSSNVRNKNVGLHTLNEYKGVVVVDLKSYNHPFFGKINMFVYRLYKMLKKK